VENPKGPQPQEPQDPGISPAAEEALGALGALVNPLETLETLHGRPAGDPLRKGAKLGCGLALLGVVGIFLLFSVGGWKYRGRGSNYVDPKPSVTMPITELAANDCIQAVPPPPTPAKVTSVDCTKPHQGQIFEVTFMRDRSFSTVPATTKATCDALAQRLFAPSLSHLSVEEFYPMQSAVPGARPTSELFACVLVAQHRNLTSLIAPAKVKA